jgi:chromosome segregation ATPase
MFENTPRLRRSFVGYSKKDVLQALDEHETMLKHAQQAAEAARSTTARLEDEIAQLRQDSEGRDQRDQALHAEVQRVTAEAEEQRQLADRYRAEAAQYRAEADRTRSEAEAQLAEAERARQEADAAQVPDRLAELLNEELSVVLATAQESAKRIVDRAEESGRAREGRAEEVWEEVQAEVDRFMGWWERVEPIIREVQKRIDETRNRADEVTDRIRQALAPTLQAMIDVDADLGRLQGSASPPELKAPSAVQEEQDDDQDHYGDGQDDRDAQDGGSAYEASENGQDLSEVVNVEEPVGSEARYDPDYWG